MSVNLSPFAGAGAQLLNNTGGILSGGKVYTYLAGTTTPAATYTTFSGGTAHANPIVLDSSGRVPGGEIWLTDGTSYKFVVKTSTDVSLYTLDNIDATVDAVDVVYTPAGADAVETTVQTKLREVISVKDFGATGNGSTDDSTAFQDALDYALSLGGATVFVPRGVYRVREIVIPNRVNLIGQGPSASKLRFMPSGDNNADSSLYTVKWEGAYSILGGLTIDGQNPGAANSYANGLYIDPDTSLGYHRKGVDLRVEWFAGYVAPPLTGGTYGVNQNYGRADIVSGSSTLLSGGNAVRCHQTDPSSELELVNCWFGNCDGTGFDEGAASDCKFSDIYVGNALYIGWRSSKDNKNNQYSNIKVYLCRRLDVRSSTSVVAFTGSSSDAQAAVIMTGAGHQFINFEAQENGSHGFLFGNTQYSFSNSIGTIFADGNGGYTSSGATAGEERYGVYAVNYYGLDIELLAENFRARVDKAAQSESWHTIGLVNKPSFTTTGEIVIDNYYVITDNTGMDVAAIQQSLATTSNANGFVFQASNSTGSASSATMGASSVLKAVNGYSNIRIRQDNMTQVLAGTGVGYNVDGDAKSTFVVNGVLLPVTVGNLPTASISKGARAMVTDSSVTTYANIVAAGGANIVPVYCDGTNWRVG